ncbi:unnamed protein product [Brachionus calyciflorus]|uniref:Uncharacterized protein n=1 Tax=Brachionus calyciflorus TaxID=104777 RepID=A0A813RJ88_9BILA|nr:unnamed protein product [Brachionus calyciflorus]
MFYKNRLFKSLVTEKDKDVIASLIPKFNLIKSGLQKSKTSFRPKLPHSVITTIIDEGKPAPQIKKLDIGRDNEIKIDKKMLTEKSIDIEVYVMSLFSFKVIKKNDSNPDESEPESEDEDEDIIDSSDLMMKKN